MDSIIVIKGRPYALKAMCITNQTLQEKIKECKKNKQKFFVRRYRAGEDWEDEMQLLYVQKKKRIEKDERLSKEYNIDMYKIGITVQ